MSANNRLLVKQCIDDIADDKGNLSRLFYRELFRLDPNLKTVLPGNTVFLNRKFFNMLAALQNVKYLENIAESVVKLGERHLIKYGAQIEFFVPVKQALLLALAEYLGKGFTPELSAAWNEVFDEVSTIMKEAMAKIDRRHQRREPYDASSYDPDLLQEIGGEDVVFRVHQRFYEVMFNHPWLGQFFFGKSEVVLITKQTQFMVAAFNGPNHYTGDTPAFIHMHMFITDEMADLRENILRKAILDEGLSASIADRWLKVDGSFRSAIVKKSVAECVMKCVGQVPVTARKPAHLES
ncbi:MAG: globin domain-containing protein [Gammaproteobacteria bacterium]